MILKLFGKAWIFDFVVEDRELLCREVQEVVVGCEEDNVDVLEEVCLFGTRKCADCGEIALHKKITSFYYCGFNWIASFCWCPSCLKPFLDESYTPYI